MSQVSTPSTGYRWMKSLTAAVAAVAVVFSGLAAAPAQAAVTAPSAPTSLVATTTGAGAVSVAWTAPKDGGSAITGYTVMQSNSSSFTTGSGTTTSTSSSASKAFTGLTAGASYYVKVSATNTKGTSAYSSALKFTAPNVPVAPSAPKVTQGIRSLAATWTAPANGGMAITGYKVQIATDAAFTSPTTTNASTLSATLSSLSDATSYYVRVAATNAVGDSNWSSATTAKTFGVPAPPTKVTVAAGQAQLNVSWPNPTTDKPVTGFRIQYSTNSNFTSSTTVDTNTTATSKIFTGLANGTTYYFKVAAISTVGTGSYSAAGSATTFSAPGAPTAVAITRGIRSLSVTFKAPAANGGSAITGYTIQYATHSDFSDAVTVTGSTAKTTITGLADNTTYYVRAYAANAVGTSAASVSASERTSALPTAVTAGTLTVGKTVGTLTAAWTALTATALDNQAIASYSVQYSTDSTFATGVTTVNAGKATTLAISGLNNNTKYYFRVMATSVVGAGSYSASLANATTLAVPEAPYAVTATGSATSIALTWSATSSSVATTGYKITYSKASTFTMPVVVDAKNVTSYTLTKLTTGTTYYIKVAAYNTVGSSAYSTPVFTTTSSVPVAPTGVTAAPVAATNRINVSWTAPAGVLTGYRVQFADDAAFTANVSVLDVNVTSAQILAGAISNGAYAGRYVRVSAANSNGYGSYSTGIHADGPSLPAATTLTLNSVSVNGTTATPNFTKVADENATTYQVEYSTNADFSGSTVENMLAVNGDNSGFAISNLTRGNTYYVRLVVKNDNGDAVVQAGATSFEVPAVNAAPTNVVVSQHPTNGYRYGQISFTAPEALPGHDYSQVLYQIADDVNFTNIVDSGYTSVTPGTSASVDSIAFNTSARILYFRLYTWHSGAMSNDQGEYSATVAYTLPTTPPTQPGYNQSMGWNKIDVSTAGDTTATLSWAPSTQTEGGDPVDHYTVTQYINNGMGMGMGMGGSLLPETIVYPADRLTPSVELSDLQTGGSYAYKVTAVSTSGSVSEATAVSFVAMGAFPTPTNVVVGQGDMSYTDIKASGVLAPDTHGRYASGIYFQISDDANFTNIIRNEYGSSMMGNPSTTFNGMTSGQTYYVRAYVQWNDWMTMRSGVSAYSDVVTYRVPTTPPTQPGMSMMGMPTINVNPTSATTATLSWTPSQAGMGGDPVDHYTVTQYVNNGMGGMMPGMGGGSLLPETIVYPADRLTPSVDLADLQTGGNYAYKVTAVSTSGAVSQATTVSFTANAPYPAPSVVVSAPTDTMMYSVTSSLKATATAVSDPGGRSAQAMYFDIATDAAFTNIVSSNNYGSMMMGNPSYTFGGLTSGQTYYVRARVQWNNWMTMSSGYGSYSTVVSGKVSTVPPTQPGLAGGMMGGMGGTINVNPTSATTATLSWTASQPGMGGDPVDHYVVEQYVASSMGGMMPGMGMGGSLHSETIVYPANRLTPSVELSNLETGASYSYRVTAVSTTDAISQATTVSFTANAPYPAPTVVVSAPTDTMMYSVTSALKATATAVSDPGGRNAQAMYFDIATDAAFTNIVSSNNYGSMMMGNPSYTFSGLTSGQTYYVRARVQWNNWMTMSSGYGSYSTVVSGKVSTVPPTAPGSGTGQNYSMMPTINVDTTSATTATLSWTASQPGMGGDAVDHYVVEQYVASSMGGMMPGMGMGGSLHSETVVYPANRLTPSVELSNLETGASYSYRVTAVSTTDAISQATTVSFTANAPFPAPTVVVSAPTDSSQYSLTSSLTATASIVADPANRSVSQVYFDLATDEAFTNVINTLVASASGGGMMGMGGGNATSSTTFTGLTSGQIYYVRARVQWYNMMMGGGSGYGSYSAITSGRVATPAPTTPSITSMATTDPLTETINWTASQQADGGLPFDHYTVAVKSQNAFMMGQDDSANFTAVITGSSATVTGLTDGQYYYVTVSAYSTDGSRSQSNSSFSFHYIAPFAAPAGFTVGVGGAIQNVHLVWATPNNNGRTIYGGSIQFSTDPTFQSNVSTVDAITWNSSENSLNGYDINGDNYGFQVGQTWYFRVAAEYGWGSDIGIYTAPIPYVMPNTPPTSVMGYTKVLNDAGTVADFSWSASQQQDGGDPVDHYTVSVVNSSTNEVMTVVYPEDRLQTTAHVEGLTPGVYYRMDIRAVSTSGSASFSSYYVSGFGAYAKPLAPLSLDTSFSAPYWLNFNWVNDGYAPGVYYEISSTSDFSSIESSGNLWTDSVSAQIFYWDGYGSRGLDKYIRVAAVTPDGAIRGFWSPTSHLYNPFQFTGVNDGTSANQNGVVTMNWYQPWTTYYYADAVQVTYSTTSDFSSDVYVDTVQMWDGWASQVQFTVPQSGAYYVKIAPVYQGVVGVDSEPILVSVTY